MYKSIFDGFELSSTFQTCKFYRNNGPFKNPNISMVAISIGHEIGNSSKIYSNPIELKYNLSEYKNLGIFLCNFEDKLLYLSEIELEIFKDINKYLLQNIYCDWHNVPTELVQSLLKEICVDSQQQEEYGCYCEVCGAYDKYAPVKNGKGKCYKHFV